MKLDSSTVNWPDQARRTRHVENIMNEMISSLFMAWMNFHTSRHRIQRPDQKSASGDNMNDDTLLSFAPPASARCGAGD